MYAIIGLVWGVNGAIWQSHGVFGTLASHILVEAVHPGKLRNQPEESGHGRSALGTSVESDRDARATHDGGAAAELGRLGTALQGSGLWSFGRS